MLDPQTGNGFVIISSLGVQSHDAIFLICQGMAGGLSWIGHFDLLREVVFLLNAWAIFCLLLCFFLELHYAQKIKSKAHNCYLLLKTPNATPPQLHCELTCFHSWKGDEGEGADEVEDGGGVSCKGKGWKDGGKYKGGKKQEDKKRVGGMCPGCGWEKKFLVQFVYGQKI